MIIAFCFCCLTVGVRWGLTGPHHLTLPLLFVFVYGFLVFVFFVGGGGEERGWGLFCCWHSCFLIVVFLGFCFLVFSQKWHLPPGKRALERTPYMNLFLGSPFVVDVVIWFLFLLLLLLVFTFDLVGLLFFVVVLFWIALSLFFSQSVFGCCCYRWFNCLLCLVCFLQRTFHVGCCCSCLFMHATVLVIVLLAGVLVVAVETICLFWLCLVPMLQKDHFYLFGCFSPWSRSSSATSFFQRPTSGMQRNVFLSNPRFQKCQSSAFAFWAFRPFWSQLLPKHNKTSVSTVLILHIWHFWKLKSNPFQRLKSIHAKMGLRIFKVASISASESSTLAQFLKKRISPVKVSNTKLCQWKEASISASERINVDSIAATNIQGVWLE